MCTDGTAMLACPYLTVIQKEVAISGGCICLKKNKFNDGIYTQTWIILVVNKFSPQSSRS